MKFIDLLNELEFFIRSEAERTSEYKELQLHEHVRELVLTEAEVLLFKKGFPKGVVECNSNKSNILRSEILSWFLHLPENYMYKFRKNKLHISNALIMSMSIHNKYKAGKYDLKNVNTNEFALDLSNMTVEIDLLFDNCTFYGGIDISHSLIENLVITSCTIGTGESVPDFFNKYKTIIPSIYGYKTNFAGNLSISHNQRQEDFLDRESYIHGEVYMPHAHVNGVFTISDIVFHEQVDLTCGRFNTLTLQNTFFIKTQLNLIYVNTDYIYLHDSRFICDFEAKEDEIIDFVTVNCKGLRANYFYCRGNSLSIGVLNLTDIYVNNTIEFRDTTLVSPLCADLDEKIDESLVLVNAKTSQLFLYNNLISFGRINANQSQISNVFLNHAKFINYGGAKSVFGTSLDFSNAIINNLLSIINDNNKKDFEVSNSQKVTTYFENAIKNVGDSSIDEGKEVKEYIKDIASKLESIKELPSLALLKRIEENDEIKNVIALNSISKKVKHELENEKVTEDHTIFIGEADFSGLKVVGKLDLAGGLFYCPCEDKKAMQSPKAINLRHTKIDGDLFINDFNNSSKFPHFRAVGRIDMHSASTTQFFVNPIRAMYKDSIWHLIGFKYNYIHCSKSYKSELFSGKWFEIENKKEPNYRQPYEQLATAIQKSGDDASAKKVIIRGRIRTSKSPFEYLLFSLIGVFSFLGVPAWRSFTILLFLFFIGLGYNDFAYTQNGFTKEDHSKIEEFHAGRYTFDNMIPLKFQEETFLSNEHDIIYSNSVFSVQLPTTKSFNYYHKIISTITLAIFIIGIAKITKKEG